MPSPLPSVDPPSLPALRHPGRWRDVPIEGVDEPLVRGADIGGRVIDDPQYFHWGLPGARPHSLVRASVAERLADVGASLPAGLTLVVWDGWRSLETQRALYEDWRGQLAEQHPDWPHERLDAETSRYVSVPSDDPRRPAPHITGAAVDLTLGDENGEPLDLGTNFDAFVPEAGAAALEDSPGPARDLRRLLFWSMIAQGFTAYVEEWWHFDHGDQFWGSILGRPALYGPADPGG